MFMFEIGKQKAAFAFMLIDQNEEELEPFLIHLLAGLWKGESSRNAAEILKEWINENKRLSVCASLFEYVEEIDITLLKEVYRLACRHNDADALSRIISAIDRNYAKYPKRDELKRIFVGAIKSQAELKNYHWIRGIWLRKSSLLDDLSLKDYEAVLDSLTFVPDIDYHAEEILSPLAKKYPKKLIQFFKGRVSKRMQKQEGERYDAIPFSLHIINKLLQNLGNVVVPEIVGWFSEKDWLFQWEASHFLQAIFPVFDKALESEIIKLVKKGGDKNAKIVISLMRAYKGEPFLHGVCKKFIKKYHSAKYEKEMFIILSQTGVVSGEYGFVEAYKAKRQEIQDWKKDKNKTIRSFVKKYEVKKYEAYLAMRIVYEQKRADEDIEMRKREFA